ncbi:MAG TPA: PIG-L family deacetylase [Planctomycetota bacterium]
MEDLSRRGVLKLSTWAAAAAGAVALPAVSQDTRTVRKTKVLFVGAHPDDVEGAAGGTMARYADQGHDVVALYLTRGEAGMKGKSHDEAGAIRAAQAEKACALLKIRARFSDQIDGTTEVNPARCDAFRKTLEEEKPDLVYTWWPINSHRDHRNVFGLVYDAWLKSKGSFELFFFENAGTQLFQPTHYVDITATEARKKEACFLHTWYKDRPDLDLYTNVDFMHRARGQEAGCKYAEAFIRHSKNRGAELPLPIARS